MDGNLHNVVKAFVWLGLVHAFGLVPTLLYVRDGQVLYLWRDIVERRNVPEHNLL